MKTKSLLIEPLLIARVVLCWILGLPAFALSLAGLAIWDTATAIPTRIRRGRSRPRFQLRRANVGA
jgi:hypothetical protein